MGNDLTRRVKDANSGQVAKQGEPPSMADQIRSMQSQFQMAMPKGAEAAQLVRDAMTCLRTTPALARCDAASVLGGLMTCAQLGLRPGVLGHAWLIPFGRQAQLVIGYQGLVELAHRSGQIKSLQARTVYANDTFDVDYGLADSLIHKPAMTGSKGEAVAYYAFAKFVTGGHAFVVMSHDEMKEYRDQNAKSKTGPWKDNFDAMAHKTCVRQLAKWMPRSTEFATAIEADNTVRVDTSVNPDAALHGQRTDYIDAEVDETKPDDGEQGILPDDPDLTAHLTEAR
ncbi:recombination protein RecT [Saccharopolyspora tripterygii]